MTNWHANKQVKILALTLRILLVEQRISQQDLLRAARIAAAEVRAQRRLQPAAPTQPGGKSQPAAQADRFDE